MPSGIDPGHTAWMLISTALVLLMTPGLAFFYGAIGIVATILFSGGMTFLLLKFLSLFMTLQSGEEEQFEGPDLVEHGEKGYYALA